MDKNRIKDLTDAIKKHGIELNDFYFISFNNYHIYLQGRVSIPNMLKLARKGFVFERLGKKQFKADKDGINIVFL